MLFENILDKFPFPYITCQDDWTKKKLPINMNIALKMTKNDTHIVYE